jgi:hypothetical protein
MVIGRVAGQEVLQMLVGEHNDVAKHAAGWGQEDAVGAYI